MWSWWAAAAIGAAGQAAPAARAADFRAMTFNLWVGGTRSQPLAQTVAAIRAAGADVVGVQEPGESLPAIAEGLGWNRSDAASIVTRFAIVDEWRIGEGNRWGGAKLRLPDGREILVYNDHFNPYPYGPYEARDRRARTIAELIAVEEDAGRMGQMLAVLADLAARPDRKLPVVFTGDFNTPSHLDWTAAGRSRTFGLTVPWPVTRAAEAAGFRDAYRTVHPDPIARPGFTWSPGYPPPNVEPDDVMDRIDFVLYRGGLRALTAEVVGEPGPISDIEVDPWPSDHRAVVAGFRFAD